MPENKDEAVVDKWVLENFMKSDSSIVRMYKKVDDVLLLIVVIFVIQYKKTLGQKVLCSLYEK